MYIKHLQNQKTTVFNIWVFGEQQNLDRGSGLFVNRQGNASNHHFLPNKEEDIEFKSGKQKIQVYAETVNERDIKIYEQSIELSKEEANKINAGINGLYFDWDPSINKYVSHLETKTAIEINPFKGLN